MSDDLAQELIAAQAAERMAWDDLNNARIAWRTAVCKTNRLTVEFGKREWVRAGVVMGETILYVRGREQEKYLAAGVDGYRGDLMVHRQTAKGKWFKRTITLHQVKPSQIVIVEGGAK
jgi:hypothetical protein